MLNMILQFVYEQSGHDFRGNHQSMLERRIWKRVLAVHADSMDAYYDYLVTTPAELAELIVVLTINVSSFFRDPLVFEQLYELLKEIIVSKQQDQQNTIRIWSAGCSGGEEAFSVAMIIDDLLRHKNLGPMDVTIFATDIDDRSLKRAEQGIYLETDIMDVKHKYVKQYFFETGNGYRISPEIRKMVCFSKYDLLDRHHYAPPESVYGNFDVVLCRNVLIYFIAEYQEIILKKLLRSLNGHGLLVLGEAEVLPDRYRGIVQRRSCGSKIYRKVRAYEA